MKGISNWGDIEVEIRYEQSVYSQGWTSGPLDLPGLDPAEERHIIPLWQLSGDSFFVAELMPFSKLRDRLETSRQPSCTPNLRSLVKTTPRLSLIALIIKGEHF